MSKKSYQISNSNGINGPAWRRTYPSIAAAAEAIRHAYGWDDVVVSDSFADDIEVDGRRVETSSCAAYATQDDCDRDQDGSRAPWITEVRS